MGSVPEILAVENTREHEIVCMKASYSHFVNDKFLLVQKEIITAEFYLGYSYNYMILFFF